MDSLLFLPAQLLGGVVTYFDWDLFNRWILVVLDYDHVILVRASTNRKIYEMLLSAGGLELGQYWLFDHLGPSSLPGIEFETTERSMPRRLG